MQGRLGNRARRYPVSGTNRGACLGGIVGDRSISPHKTLNEFCDLCSHCDVIVLAPIQKIRHAAPIELLAESIRGRSLTPAFGLVSVPGLEIRAAPPDMPKQRPVTYGKNGGRYASIATINDCPRNDAKHPEHYECSLPGIS